MAIFRPYVEAVQWTGTNVIEIRQFVRANQGFMNDAVIDGGVLYLVTNPPPPLPSERIAVPVGNWLVRSGVNIESLTDAEFLSRYTP